MRNVLENLLHGQGEHFQKEQGVISLFPAFISCFIAIQLVYSPAD